MRRRRKRSVKKPRQRSTKKREGRGQNKEAGKCRKAHLKDRERRTRGQ